MNTKNSNLLMEYCLLSHVTDVTITNDEAVLLTFGKSPHAPEQVARLIPTIHGLTLFFDVYYSINLNLNDSLLDVLLDDDFMDSPVLSPLEVLQEVLRTGLEYSYAFDGDDEVPM